MPRKPNITPSAKIQVWVPASLKARLDLYLWSELENRIPPLAQKNFFIDLLNDFFKRNPHVNPRPRSDEPCSEVEANGGLGRDDGRGADQGSYLAEGETPGSGNRFEYGDDEDEIL
jgi:hypothetical protein